MSLLQSVADAKKKARVAADEELTGMNKLLTTMNEQKVKIAKALSKDSVASVKKAISNRQTPAGAVDILDRLCQFMAKDTSATYDKQGRDLFENHETLAKAIKATEPSYHEKAWLRDVADSVNMNADGLRGKLLAQVMEPETAKQMVTFVPYFKLLYKFCQLGMTLKTKESLIRKHIAATEECERVIVELETLDKRRQNLRFYERID